MILSYRFHYLHTRIHKNAWHLRLSILYISYTYINYVYTCIHKNDRYLRRGIIYASCFMFGSLVIIRVLVKTFVLRNSLWRCYVGVEFACMQN